MTDPNPTTPTPPAAAKCAQPRMTPFGDRDGVCGHPKNHPLHYRHDAAYHHDFLAPALPDPPADRPWQRDGYGFAQRSVADPPADRAAAREDWFDFNEHADEALAPCPFCGAPAYRVQLSGYQFGKVRVGCHHCAFYLERCRDEADSAWNHRADGGTR
jgi:hypothetical protein